MNQVFWKSEARRDRQGNAESRKALSAGLALLFVVMGAVGCGGDPVTGVEEPIDSAPQEWGNKGENGVTPAILAAGHLGDVSTFPVGINSYADGRPVDLCTSFAWNNVTAEYDCPLKTEWKKWLLAYGAAHPITKDRYQLLKAMVHCSMDLNVAVHVTGFADLHGMFGLYPSWSTDPLEMYQRKVLSACVSAKVNAFGAVVPIGFVGPDVPQPISDPSFKYQEAAFFGDLFGKAPLVMACSGKKDSGGSYVVGKNLRVCGLEGNPCHIKALGACDAGTHICDEWAGSGSNEHCVMAHNGAGGLFTNSLMVYLKTEPKILSGDIKRCGLSGMEICDDEAPGDPP